MLMFSCFKPTLALDCRMSNLILTRFVLPEIHGKWSQRLFYACTAETNRRWLSTLPAVIKSVN